MSEALWMTCHRDPKWAAREIERLRSECKRLDEGLNRACDRITDLQRPPAVMGITMKFETHCPNGQKCGAATTTGCLEGTCQLDSRLSQPKWQQRITGGRGGMVECHVANGRVLMVHWYPDEEGWELYISASVSNKTSETLAAADAYLKVQG